MASVRMTAGFRVYRFIDAYGFSCLGFRALGVYLLKPSLGGGVVLGRIQVFRPCWIVAPPQTQLPSRVQYRSLNNKNGVLGGGGCWGVYYTMTIIKNTKIILAIAWARLGLYQAWALGLRFRCSSV